MENQVSFDGLDFSPEINLSRYLQNIKQFPILSQEEEYNLAKEYVRTRDAKISYRLVTSHLRLVVKVVSKFRGYGLPVAEMISEGNIGLLYAVDKFDPDKGFVFPPMPCGGSGRRCRNMCSIPGRWSKSAPPPRRKSCFSICARLKTG